MIIVNINITTLSVIKEFAKILNVKKDILEHADVEKIVSLIFIKHVPICTILTTNPIMKKLKNLLKK